MTKRRLIQRNLAEKARFARFTKEVVLKKGLKLTPERRAIRWFGKLRKLLMDPSLGAGEPDDLFCHATAVDHQNYRRMTGPPPKADRQTFLSKKQRKLEWEEALGD